MLAGRLVAFEGLDEHFDSEAAWAFADKAIGSATIGRRALTHRAASDKQVQFSPMSLQVHSPVPYSLVGPRLGPRFLGDIRKLLKDMVGTRRLELLTSTVSR